MQLKALLFSFLLFIGSFGVIAANLGISQDETPQGYYHWSSAAHFNEDHQTVLNNLPALAKAAYEEMTDDFAHHGIRDISQPSAISALAIGSDVYFSSSLKGGQFLVDPGSVQNYIQPGVAQEVDLAIFRCQQQYKSGHRYDANCGEPLACQQFLVSNQGSNIIGQAQVATYGVQNPDDRTQTAILNPCDIDSVGNWGCQVFLDKLQIKGVRDYDGQPPAPAISPQRVWKPCFWT